VLKKMVEKTRAENERLKNTPAFTSADQLAALQAENSELKVDSVAQYLVFISLQTGTLVLYTCC